MRNPLKSPRGRRQIAPVFCLCLILCLGCSEPDTPITFRYHLPAAPVSLDPALAGDLYSHGVIDRLFDGLLRLDRKNNELRPELARSYTVSDDGLVYEFQLREDTRFHNGRPVTAEDVKYSWERLARPAERPPFAWLLDFLVGAVEFHEGRAETISGLEVLSPSSLRIRLKQPYGPFLYHLSYPSAAIVPREEVERLGPRFGREPIGSGPFRFVESVDADRIELAAWDGSSRPKPQAERLIFRTIPQGDEAIRQYRAGDLDLVTHVLPSLTSQSDPDLAADLQVSPGLSWSGLCFRTDVAPFDDVRVRRAVSLAIHREELARRAGSKGYAPAVGFLPPTVPGHNPDLLQGSYDPEEARRLMAEAGYPEGEGLEEITYATRPGNFDALVAKLVEESLGKIGLKIRTVSMDFSSLSEAIAAGRYTIFRRAWLGEYPNAIAFFKPAFWSRGHGNYSQYANPRFDALLDSAARESVSMHGNEERQSALAQEAEAVLLEDLPCINLVHRIERVLLQPKWSGLEIGTHPYFLEIEKARLAD